LDSNTSHKCTRAVDASSMLALKQQTTPELQSCMSTAGLGSHCVPSCTSTFARTFTPKQRAASMTLLSRLMCQACENARSQSCHPTSTPQGHQGSRSAAINPTCLLACRPPSKQRPFTPLSLLFAAALLPPHPLPLLCPAIPGDPRAPWEVAVATAASSLPLAAQRSRMYLSRYSSGGPSGLCLRHAAQCGVVGCGVRASKGLAHAVCGITRLMHSTRGLCLASQ
jgi:hypothetical protein